VIIQVLSFFEGELSMTAIRIDMRAKWHSLLPNVPFWCLNLTRRPDRWAEMEDQFVGQGIQVERIEAVDGRQLQAEHRALVSWRAAFDLSQSANRENHAALTGAGSVGCALSHASLWQRMIDNNVPLAAIFEDDVQFTADAYPTFEKVWQEWTQVRQDRKISENQWHAMMLAPFHTTALTKLSPRIDRIDGQFFGLGFYLMTLAGAKELLKTFYPIEVQVDSMISYRTNPYITDQPLTIVTAKGVAEIPRFTLSDVQNGWCIKCYLPKHPQYYALLVLIFVWIYLAIQRCRAARL